MAIAMTAAGIVLAAALGVTGAAVAAQQVVIVADDRGGPVNDRAMLVDRLRAAGAHVEIRGSVCLSACTMYLGAGDVCVSPQTTFGFHGPSNNGAPLAPDRFDHWSQVMARYYNGPLQDWFMTQARYQISGYQRLTGADLIRLGYRSC